MNNCLKTWVGKCTRGWRFSGLEPISTKNDVSVWMRTQLLVKGVFYFSLTKFCVYRVMSTTVDNLTSVDVRFWRQFFKNIGSKYWQRNRRKSCDPGWSFLIWLWVNSWIESIRENSMNSNPLQTYILFHWASVVPMSALALTTCWSSFITGRTTDHVTFRLMNNLWVQIASPWSWPLTGYDVTSQSGASVYLPPPLSWLFYQPPPLPPPCVIHTYPRIPRGTAITWSSDYLMLD